MTYNKDRFDPSQRRRLDQGLFLLAALAAAALFLWLLASLADGYSFPLPDDPNFLVVVGPCIGDPNCREALTQYIQRMSELEKKENDPNSNVRPVKWKELHEIRRVRLQALFEHWLHRDTTRKGFRQPIFFDPNETRIEVFGLNRVLNTQTECIMRWWRDDNGYWVDKYYRVLDGSDYNRDGVVNLADFNLILKDK